MTRVVMIVDGISELSEAVFSRLAQLDYRVTAILPNEMSDATHHRMQSRTEACLHVERCDMNDRDALRLCVDTIEKTIGAVEILIGHAGISYELIQVIGERMAERDWGRIIEIAALAQTGPNHHSHVSSDENRRKQQRIKALALRLGPQGVTVNMISPSRFGAPGDSGEPGQQLATGRLSQAEEIAGLVAYLASDEAGFLNGANIAVSIGRRMA